MNFYKYMSAFPGQYDPRRSEQSKKLLFLLDKEIVLLCKKGVRLGLVNGEEVTRQIRVSLARSVCTDFLAPSSPSLVI